ncbi:MAG: hypothetical protein BVN28_06630 [Nitrospira sp. ST-bin4]|nr:MAG: hypothetical protein BVN28_06630 [Nitrospira sp. ST-bin4]
MRSVTTRSNTLVIAALAHVLVSLDVAHAGFTCSGILTEAQQAGFNAMFTPAYSPALTHIGGRVEPANMSKKLDEPTLKRLKVKEPTVAAKYTLTEPRAKTLQGWLNDNATTTLPGWVSTAIGIAAPSAWAGVSADVFLQLVNAQGEVGRLKVANIAGTVSAGGHVGVLEQVSPDKAEKLKFIYAYVYSYQLNGKQLTTPLTICSADVAQ